MKAFYAVCLSTLVAGHALAAKVKPAAAADAAAPAARPEAQNIAVMNLDGISGVETSQAELMSDILRTELYKTGRFTVMNREDMDSILKEIKYQQSGACDQTSCIVEMGQALGVERMVAGTVGLLGERYVINAKLINVATSKNEILVTEYLSKEAAADPQEVFRRVALQLAGEKVDPISTAGAKTPAAKSKPKVRYKRFVLGVSGGIITGNLAGRAFSYLAQNDSFSVTGGCGVLDLTYRFSHPLSLTVGVGTGIANGRDNVTLTGGTSTNLVVDADASKVGGRATIRARLGKAALKPYIGAGVSFGTIKIRPKDYQVTPQMGVIEDSVFSAGKDWSYTVGVGELGILVSVGSNYELSFGVFQEVGGDRPPIKQLLNLGLGFGFVL